MNNEKKTKPRSTKATSTTDAVEFALTAVSYSADRDGWGDFTCDLSANILFDGGGDYYQHTKGADFVSRIYKLDGMSAEHSAVISSKQLYVCGQGLNIGENPSPAMVAFYDNAPEAQAEQAKASIAQKLGLDYTSSVRAESMAGINLDKLTKLIAKDLVQLGGSYLLVYISGGKIQKQIHVPFHSVLRAKKKEGDIDGLAYWYITSDGKVSKTTPRVQQFSPRHLDEQVQLVDLRLPHCADTMYAHPDYLAALKWILLDGYIATFFNAFAEKNFWLGAYVKTGKNPPKEVREKIQREMNAKFAGTSKAGTVAYLWGADELTEIGSFPINSSDDLFVHQQKWISSKIRTAHKVTEPALLGLPSDENAGSVFAAKDQLKTAMIVWQNTVIAPVQFVITDWFNEALRFNAIEDTVSITAFSPLHEGNEAKNTTAQVLNEGETSGVPIVTDAGTNDGATAPAANAVQDLAMNGAQDTAFIDIIVKVGQGLITKKTAVPLIRACFPAVSIDLINEMIDGVQPIATTANPAN